MVFLSDSQSLLWFRRSIGRIIYSSKCVWAKGHRESVNQRIREVLITYCARDFLSHVYFCMSRENKMLQCLKKMEFKLLKSAFQS